MRGHNVATVLAFEVRRTLAKPTFWLTALAAPLLLIVLMLLSLLSTSQTAEAMSGGADVPFTYTDASGLVDPGIAERAGGRLVTDAAAARHAVVAGQADAHIDYPADPASEPIVVTARDRGMLANGSYAGTADLVLRDSVRAKLPDPRWGTIVSGRTDIQVASYADGVRTPGWEAALVPGLFGVVFLLSVIMLGQQLVNITVEEKENRITEMLLTSVRPTPLIVGKLLAVLVVGLVQLVVFALPATIVGTLLTPPRAPTPGVPIPSAPTPGAPVPLPTDAVGPSPLTLAFAVGILLAGWLTWAGLLVVLGSIVANARDAASGFGGLLIVMILPLYVFPMVIGDPRGPASQALTFFPLTGPLTAFARNATGTLAPAEAVAVILVLAVTGIALLTLGVRLFGRGALAYDARLKFRSFLSNPGKSARTP